MRYKLVIGSNLTLREAKDLANKYQMQKLAADVTYCGACMLLFLVGMFGDAIADSIARLLP